jgi:hypothetical protein
MLPTRGILELNGEALCWGTNANGEATPPSGVVFYAISAMKNVTCGIRQADSIEVCWGAYNRNRWR